MRILFTGGGTLGSVTPLIGVYDYLSAHLPKDQLQVLWVGTRSGPEYALLKERGIPCVWVYAGKLRRYFSIKNFLDPFLLLVGIVQSCVIILRFQPDIVINAGSFVGVPVLFAGGVLMRKCALLQLDIKPSLSNLITKNFVDRIGVSVGEAAKFFPQKKVTVVGIPVRKEVDEWKEKMHDPQALHAVRASLGIHDEKPLALVTGGGTGARAINTLVVAALPQLTPWCHVVHLTGTGKEHEPPIENSSYHPFPFLTDQCIPAMAVADAVVTRAGFGTLADLAALGKATIIIPIPDSHQEANAVYFEKKGAARYLSQKKLTPEIFAAEIRKVIERKEVREALEVKISTVFPPNSAQKVCEAILQMKR